MPSEFLDLAAYYGQRYAVEKLHVHFVSPRKKGLLGQASDDGVVRLYLHCIWYYGQKHARWRGCGVQAALWFELLYTFLHEVRHIQQQGLADRHPWNWPLP